MSMSLITIISAIDQVPLIQRENFSIGVLYKDKINAIRTV
jgi:hypothetical protein